MTHGPRITERGYRAGVRPGNYGKKYPPTLLQPEEVARLLAACGRDAGSMRNKALIAVLYRAGTLLSEALALRLSDVDRADQTLRIEGGRQIPRTIGMDATAFAMLEAWLKVREKRGIPGDRVFCTFSKPTPGRPLDDRYFRPYLHALAARAGLGETRVHPQAFRFSLAADLIVEGWPLPYIQAQLGIATLYAMQRFLKNLEIPPPDDAEVIGVVRGRVWDLDV